MERGSDIFPVHGKKRKREERDGWNISLAVASDADGELGKCHLGSRIVMCDVGCRGDRLVRGWRRGGAVVSGTTGMY